ncbi:MAG: DUF1214 domain-containing protein [Beijerinckiaceae bacterium]|nr:DUF1214 domain-containing protein [Beijerinckiaceae bacterium]
MKTIVAGLVGVALGLAATWLALERGVAFGDTQLGPWSGNARAAFSDADPYTRAERARTGESPLSPAEGMMFLAARDSDGARLDPRCDYVFSGALPAARLWTLSSIDRDGRPVANPAGRNAISSAELVRDQDGRFEIIASSRARSGNWLPIAGDASFQFMLRLYDTTGGAAAGVMSDEQMPSLRRAACP